MSAQTVLLVTLLATLVGTVLAFTLMHWLLSPVGDLTRALRTYRTDGVRPALSVDRLDDVGRLTLEFRELISTLEEKIALLKRQALTDALTGLGNRRWLAEAANTEVARAKRSRNPLAVIVFDLDHFKRINDDFGHDAGDAVLIAVSAAAQRVMRPYDLIARIGGEEFCAILPQTGLREAKLVAERLRSEIECLTIASLEGRPVTASFGVHQAEPAREQFREMLRRADEHLYEAKANGRNRVVATPVSVASVTTP